MSVNRISQSHANEAEAVQNVNSQKAQNTATKEKAVDGQGTRSHADAPAQTRPKVTAADNNAGHEQSRQQNTENDTNGNRVNVLA